MALPARRSAYSTQPPRGSAPRPQTRTGLFRLLPGKSRKPAPKIENVVHRRGKYTFIFQNVNGKTQRVAIQQSGKKPTLMGPKQYVELRKRVVAYKKKHPHSSAAQIAVGLAASHVEVFKGLAKEGAHSFLASLIDLM